MVPHSLYISRCGEVNAGIGHYTPMKDRWDREEVLHVDSRKIFEYQGKSMKMHENAWKSMKIYENQWKLMKINENQRKSMKIIEINGNHNQVNEHQ